MIEVLATKDNQPYKVEFKTWKFPSGEIGVKLLNFEGVDFNGCSVRWDYVGNNDELMEVLQFSYAINAIDTTAHIDLVVPYLPYSRQDRVCHSGEANSLAIFLHMIRLQFRNIYTLDVHNEDEFLKQTYHKQGVNIPQSICASNLPKYDIFIAPDAGAAKKIYSHRQVCQEKNPTKVITLSKTRVDGKVIYDPLPCGTIPAGSRVCVVDDLSDGNGTFIALAAAIEDRSSLSSFDLYVTHGLFTKGLDNIRDLYGKVYVSNLVNESLKNDQLLEILSSPRS